MGKYAGIFKGSINNAVLLEIFVTLLKRVLQFKPCT